MTVLTAPPARDLTAAEAQALLADARTRTLHLLGGLQPEQLLGPKADTLNPPLWEAGHVAFFTEVFLLRGLGAGAPLLPGAEELYDSFEVPHAIRWDLPLPTRQATQDYGARVLEHAQALLGQGMSPQASYLAQLCTLHEDMHGEAGLITRQTLGYPAPAFGLEDGAPEEGGALPGDVAVPGGTWLLGARRGDGYAWDNEKWAHPVELAPFRIARAPVTNADYLPFIAEGGYARPEFWSFGGRLWLKDTGAQHPRMWRQQGGQWERRHFDRWLPLAPHEPAVHITWHEAQAWCAWAGRRLPTEAEWEAAATGTAQDGHLGGEKRRYPWGDAAPTSQHANLEGWHEDVLEVGALPAGDSAFGCRQMLGNVWEWTDTPFYPYPGYELDRPYKEYSAPWFGYNKVMRGGAWTSRARLVRSTFRNFYHPTRHDMFAGFRTCALD